MSRCEGCERDVPLYGRKPCCAACYQRKQKTGSYARRMRPTGMGFVEALAYHGITIDLPAEPCVRPVGLKPSKSGYFATHMAGRPMQIHVGAWMLKSGMEVPDGLEVRHMCGNGGRGCCNPHHLTVGTHAENMADARPTWRRGEDHWSSKLTERDVREVRRRLREGESQRSIARAFGLHQVTVSQIKLRKRWAHLS